MSTPSIVPGTVSKELLAALGVPEGAPPPWQGRLHAFGVPFDFRADICRLRSPERFLEVRTLHHRRSYCVVGRAAPAAFTVRSSLRLTNLSDPASVCALVRGDEHVLGLPDTVRCLQHDEEEHSDDLQAQLFESGLKACGPDAITSTAAESAVPSVDTAQPAETALGAAPVVPIVPPAQSVASDAPKVLAPAGTQAPDAADELQDDIAAARRPAGAPPAAPTKRSEQPYVTAQPQSDTAPAAPAHLVAPTAAPAIVAAVRGAPLARAPPPGGQRLNDDIVSLRGTVVPIKARSPAVQPVGAASGDGGDDISDRRAGQAQRAEPAARAALWTTSSRGSQQPSADDVSRMRGSGDAALNGDPAAAPGCDEGTARLHASATEWVPYDVRARCAHGGAAAVSRLRGSGPDEAGRFGGKIDLRSLQRVAAGSRPQGPDLRDTLRNSSLTRAGLPGQGGAHPVQGGFVRQASGHAAPRSPPARASARLSADRARDQGGSHARRSHSEQRSGGGGGGQPSSPPGPKGMELRGLLSQKRRSPSPARLSAAQARDAAVRRALQRVRHEPQSSTDTPPWDGTRREVTPDPEYAQSRHAGHQRAGLVARLSRSPDARSPRGAQARATRRRSSDALSMSLTPRGGSRLATPDGAQAQPRGKSRPPRDSAADYRATRAAGQRAAASAGNASQRDAHDGVDAATRAVRAELALVAGLDAAMASHLEPQLVRGLQGASGVDLAATARILVQRVAAAVLPTAGQPPAAQSTPRQPQELAAVRTAPREAPPPHRSSAEPRHSRARAPLQNQVELQGQSAARHPASPQPDERGTRDARAPSDSRERRRDRRRTDDSRDRTASPRAAEHGSAEPVPHARKRARGSRDRDAPAARAGADGAAAVAEDTPAGPKLSRREEIQAAQKARELRRKREAMGLDSGSDGDGYQYGDGVMHIEHQAAVYGAQEDDRGGFVRVVHSPRGGVTAQHAVPAAEVAKQQQPPPPQPHGGIAGAVHAPGQQAGGKFLSAPHAAAKVRVDLLRTQASLTGCSDCASAAAAIGSDAARCSLSSVSKRIATRPTQA